MCIDYFEIIGHNYNKINTLIPNAEAVAQRCSVKKVFLEILQNSRENTCARVTSVIKLQACNFIKKRLRHRCFPMNIAKFLRTLILQNISDGCFRQKSEKIIKNSTNNQSNFKLGYLITFHILVYFFDVKLQKKNIQR